ncbi:MAG TPA: RNA polymerase sigma factor [Gemmataceae bacterium]|nr:RNA polymerase sigma factor [Gemmataceae bacterium]
MRNLLQEYVPGVYRFALRLTHDPHAAEDLTQEAFLRAWRNSALLRRPEALRAWLFRITVNLWRDQIRRGKLPVARAGRLHEHHADPEPTPPDRVDGQEDLGRALAAMEALPQRQREVLYLSACQGLSAAEIASVLKISADAVKASLCQARKKLRQDLKDLYEDRFPVG